MPAQAAFNQAISNLFVCKKAESLHTTDVSQFRTEFSASSSVFLEVSKRQTKPSCNEKKQCTFK